MAKNKLPNSYSVGDLKSPMCYVNQDAFHELAGTRLTTEAMRLFFMLLTKVNSANQLLLNNTKLAKEMEVSRPSISRSIKSLCEHDIIIKDDRSDVDGIYMFNPYVVRKEMDCEKVIDDFEELLEKRNTANK